MECASYYYDSGSRNQDKKFYLKFADDTRRALKGMQTKRGRGQEVGQCVRCARQHPGAEESAIAQKRKTTVPPPKIEEAFFSRQLTLRHSTPLLHTMASSTSDPGKEWETVLVRKNNTTKNLLISVLNYGANPNEPFCV